MKVRSDPTCPFCQEEEETALHLLGRCSALSTTRFTLLGLYRMDYNELGNIRWPLLLKLAKASRRFLWPLAYRGSAMGPPGGLSAGCFAYG